MTKKPMVVTLDGPKAKIERAKRHFKELYSAFVEFRKREPYRVLRDNRNDSKRNIFKVQIVEPIPPEFGLMIGDCAHNLRVALDHTVCQSVRLNRRDIGGSTGFPIVKSPKKLEAALVGKIKGTSPKVGLLIRRLKPYPRDDRAIAQRWNKCFFAISQLDNTDKHEMILPIWANFPHASMQITSNGVVTEIACGEFLLVEHGTKLFTSSYLEIDQDVKFTFEIAFREPEVVESKAVIPTLHQLIQFTERVVDIFDRHVFTKAGRRRS